MRLARMSRIHRHASKSVVLMQRQVGARKGRFELCCVALVATSEFHSFSELVRMSGATRWLLFISRRYPFCFGCTPYIWLFFSNVLRLKWSDSEGLHLNWSCASRYSWCAACATIFVVYSLRIPRGSAPVLLDFSFTSPPVNSFFSIKRQNNSKVEVLRFTHELVTPKLV